MGGKDQNNPEVPIQQTQPVAEKAPRRQIGKHVNPAPPATSDLPMEEAAGTQNIENMDAESNMTNSTVTQSQAGNGKRRGKGKQACAKRPSVWTAKKEEKLIEMYEERSFLFNMSHPGYSNRNKKNAAILHIAKTLGIEGRCTCT